MTLFFVRILPEKNQNIDFSYVNVLEKILQKILLNK